MSENEHMADSNMKSSSDLPTSHIASTSNNSTTTIENGLESYEIVEAERKKENEIIKLKLLKAEKRKKKRENKQTREHLRLKQEKVNIEKVEKLEVKAGKNDGRIKKLNKIVAARNAQIADLQFEVLQLKQLLAANNIQIPELTNVKLNDVSSDSD